MTTLLSIYKIHIDSIVIYNKSEQPNEHITISYEKPDTFNGLARRAAHAVGEISRILQSGLHTESNNLLALVQHQHAIFGHIGIPHTGTHPMESVLAELETYHENQWPDMVDLHQRLGSIVDGSASEADLVQTKELFAHASETLSRVSQVLDDYQIPDHNVFLD